MTDFIAKLKSILASYVSWSAVTGTVEDVVDGGYDITLRLADVISKGPFIDARAFGVVGDGFIDDTAAVQSVFTESTSGVIIFPPGVYKIKSTITCPETCLCSVLGFGKDNENNGTIFEADLSSSGVLFDFVSFRWRFLKDFAIKTASGSQIVTKYINVRNGVSIRMSHSQFERIRIIGNSKLDGNVGIDLGDGDTVQGDTLSFRDIDIQKVGTGIKFNHGNIVGLEGSKLHVVDTLYGIAFADSVTAPTGVGGGVANFTSIQHSSNDVGTDETVVYIRAAGTGSSYTFTNISTEKNAVLLDASAAASSANQTVVNLIAPRVSRNDRTNPYLKIGPATVVNQIGGQIRTTVGVDSVVMTGSKDVGDSLLNISGSYLEDSSSVPLSPFTISADVNSFYTIRDCFKYVSSVDEVWTEDVVFYSRSSARTVMPDVYKMPTALTGHIYFPLHTNNADAADKRLIRILPPNTTITRLIVNITATTAMTGYFHVSIPYTPANYVGRIDATVTGLREYRMGDSSGGLGSDYDFNLSDALFTLTSGSIAFRRSDDDCKNATGYVYVEYMYNNCGVRWDII